MERYSRHFDFCGVVDHGDDSRPECANCGRRVERVNASGHCEDCEPVVADRLARTCEDCGSVVAERSGLQHRLCPACLQAQRDCAAEDAGWPSRMRPAGAEVTL